MQLTKLELRGFKSIRSMPDDLTFRQMNILIGANGAGKSNFISFFKMLGWMTGSDTGLQEFISRSGGGNSILRDGAQVTEKIEASLTLEAEQGQNDYYMRLFHVAPDTMIFAEEKCRFTRNDWGGTGPWVELGAGHKGTALRHSENQTARTILRMMQQCKVYQFHNTSETARIRQKWSRDDNRWLREDGANLAPFLLRLRETEPRAYRRIIETIKQITPFFDDFVLDP